MSAFQKMNATHVTDTRVHDLDQSLSGLEVLGLNNIIILDLDVTVCLLDKGTSCSFRDLLLRVGHCVGRDRFLWKAGNMICLS
jgi:hypothetical protein